MVEAHSALVNIDLNQFREFVSDFMAQMKISLIALGNTHMEDIKDLADIVERMSYKALCDQASSCVEKVSSLNSSKNMMKYARSYKIWTYIGPDGCTTSHQTNLACGELQ